MINIKPFTNPVPFKTEGSVRYPTPIIDDIIITKEVLYKT